MGGHMGDDRVTAKNHVLVAIDVEKNLLVVKGTVPGPAGGYCVVKNGQEPWCIEWILNMIELTVYNTSGQQVDTHPGRRVGAGRLRPVRTAQAGDRDVPREQARGHGGDQEQERRGRLDPEALPAEGHGQRPCGYPADGKASRRRRDLRQEARGISARRCRRSSGCWPGIRPSWPSFAPRAWSWSTGCRSRSPRTKDFVAVLKNLKIDRSCLVAVREYDENVYKSARNVQQGGRAAGGRPERGGYHESPADAVHEGRVDVVPGSQRAAAIGERDGVESSVTRVVGFDFGSSFRWMIIA